MIDFDFEVLSRFKILVYLGLNKKSEVIASNISKDLDFTLSTCIKSMKLLFDKGLITSEKIGRKKIIKLTKKGDILSECLIKARGIYG